jgi:hypothetical protein
VFFGARAFFARGSEYIFPFHFGADIWLQTEKLQREIVHKIEITSQVFESCRLPMFQSNFAP